MKNLCRIGAFIAFVSCACAQVSESERHGTFGVGQPSKRKLTNPYATTQATWDDYRTVTGRVFNIQKSTFWSRITGEVKAESDGVLILEHYIADKHSYYALTNFTGLGTSGETVSIVAMRRGKFLWGDIPVDLYDCGTPYRPPTLQTNLPSKTATNSTSTKTNSPPTASK